MLSNKNRFESLATLNDELQGHYSLADEDKRRLQQDINKLKKNWQSLEDKVETNLKRSVKITSSQCLYRK